MKTPSEKIHQTVLQAHDDHKEQVKAIFPKLNRNLTGYDLANIRNDQNEFNLNAVLCGSEGTLAMVSEIKVNLLPIPETSALVLVFYQSFQESLQDAQTLMAARPGSIETIDSRVLGLAKADSIWESVKDFFPQNSDAIDGINFVEFTGDSEDELHDGIARLVTELNKTSEIERCGHQIVMGTANVKKNMGHAQTVCRTAG